MSDDVYKIALNLIPRVGPVTAKKLIAYTGSAEAVFNEKPALLQKIPGVNQAFIKNIEQSEALELALQELAHIKKHGLKILFYLDANYPKRLKNCEDAPVTLFVKGELAVSPVLSVAIVGTRKPTPYGIEMCNKLVSDLAVHFPKLHIISGLAYGIDIEAHRAALDNSLPTTAVLGHGFSHLYPASHRKYAEEIQHSGGLVTEFSYERRPDAGNFISRNRVIAGLADVTVVVESGVKGGALITADLAFSYNREVAAFPGRAVDKMSGGTNQLIKSNKAALIESAADLVQLMGWETRKTGHAQQQVLFAEPTPDEKLLLDLLQESGQLSIDELSFKAQKPVSIIMATLLQLEFGGRVKALPGNTYRILS